MPEYLYRIQPVRPEMLVESTPEEDARVAEHFAHLQALAKSGSLILAGRTLNTDATAFGIVIFRASSDEEARSIVDADPAVRHGVMRAELFPYRVALVGETDAQR